MRTEVIKADTIDVAVEGILNELNKSKQNVIYFDGWDGLGASSVLRSVAQRLALKEPMRPQRLEFDLVIHIDCSKWENTRSVQRGIAEQLRLPTSVMKMFDKQDEEGDFDGIIDLGSRVEIAEVTAEIPRGILSSAIVTPQAHAVASSNISPLIFSHEYSDQMKRLLPWLGNH